jgi:hypothetical protein
MAIFTFSELREVFQEPFVECTETKDGGILNLVSSDYDSSKLWLCFVCCDERDSLPLSLQYLINSVFNGPTLVFKIVKYDNDIGCIYFK